jgi:hypothetical protein
MMKRLAMAAFLLLAASSAWADAGPLPKPKSLVDQDRPTTQSHSVRGNRAKLPQPARGFGGNDSYRGLRVSHGVRGK